MKIEAIMIMTPKQRKDLYAAFLGCKRIIPIKRTRKRQIAKAKHMMACHDQRVMSGHSGGSKALGNRRGGRNESITVVCGDCLCNGNYYHNDYLQD